MSSEESDVEINTEVPKKVKKVAKPKETRDAQEIQETKKLSTKEMIINALSGSKSRKGISLYAIKKHMRDNFNVDIDRINHLIKKNIKEGVETGIIIQTKGVGAAGSFRLAPQSKLKPSKKLEKPKDETEKVKKSDKPMKTSSKIAHDDGNSTKKVKDAKVGAKAKPVKNKKEPKNLKNTKLSTVYESPKPRASESKTPKKKSMMKRKSIGSIIKKPKMKPTKT